MPQSTYRYHHLYSHVANYATSGTKDIPSVFRQAEALGGTFTRIVRGLPEDSFVNFSPSIIKRGDKTLVAWRSQPQPFIFKPNGGYAYANEMPNELYFGYLQDDQTILGASKMYRKKHRLSYEDPRLFVAPDNDLYVQFVASAYASKYARDENPYEAKVLVAHLDELGTPTTTVCPPIGQNRIKGKTEKNWCFYPEDGLLYCLYSVYPLVIEREQGENITLETRDVLSKVTKNAPTFNSLPPIDLDGPKLIFYHWKDVRSSATGFKWLEYKLGAFLVTSDYKKVLAYTEEPLFTGSRDDQLIMWTNDFGTPVSTQPAVILPFGAYVEGDELVMSLGVNDAYMGIFRTKLENILNKLKSTTANSSLPSPSSPKQYQTPPQRDSEAPVGRRESGLAPVYNGLRQPITIRVGLTHQT